LLIIFVIFPTIGIRTSDRSFGLSSEDGRCWWC